MEDSYGVRSRHLLQVSENLCAQMTELQGLRKTVAAAEKSRQTPAAIVERPRVKPLLVNSALSTQCRAPAD